MTDEESFLLGGIPEIDDFAEAYAAIASPPEYRDGERLLPPVQRRRIVARRLSSYFKPGMRHLRLYEGVLGQIRDGYLGRSRTMVDHERRIREAADLHERGELAPKDDATVRFTSKAIGLNNTSVSSLLIGAPGMGKSLTMEEILRRVPEVVQHRDGVHLDQVCWMKLDCPHKGSVRSLCIDFFAEMDRILGFEQPRYLKMYAAMKSTEEQMMSHMALVANLHALGILVIDEVQHLSGSDGHLLRFLVTLINKIGVPVMLIGTMDAIDVMGSTGRLARRGTGTSSAAWERYEAGHPDWRDFVEDLWKYQWTAVHTDLTSELSERIYFHSQGIVDLAVKLFLLAQMRAIRMGARREETITEALIDAVAKEEMTLVAPLVAALRSGDRAAIRKYKDLSSLSEEVAKVIRSDLGESGFVLPNSKPAVRGHGAGTQPDEQTDEVRFAQIFDELGIARDVGSDMLAEAKEREPDAGFFRLIDIMRESLKASVAKPKRGGRTGQKAARVPIPMPDGDVRRIVAAGAEVGRTPYMSLVLAGLAGPQSYFRAA